MSWSLSAIGTKDKVRASVEADFDKAIAQYAGRPEGDDVLAAKTRCLACIDGLPEISPTEQWNGVDAKAYGSRSAGFSVTISVVVTRVHLAL